MMRSKVDTGLPADLPVELKELQGQAIQFLPEALDCKGIKKYAAKRNLPFDDNPLLLKFSVSITGNAFFLFVRSLKKFELHNIIQSGIYTLQMRS